MRLREGGGEHTGAHEAIGEAAEVLSCECEEMVEKLFSLLLCP